MSDQKQHVKISLEDLLRLKRAERPDAQFWVKFDASLRHKQLSAIIQPRSRWHFLEFLRQNRAYFFASAGAGVSVVLAVAVSLRGPVGGQIGEAPSAVVDAGVHMEALHASEVVALPVHKLVVSDPDPAVESHLQPVQTTNVAVAVSSVGISRPATEVSEPSPVVIKVVQVANRLNADVNLFPATSLVSGGLSNTSVSAPEVDISVSTKDAPVFTAVSVTDSRKARFLASVEQTSASGRSLNNPRLARGRERIGSSISDESIYDSIHRLGLNGDRLSIRF